METRSIKITVEMALASHLSDIQELLSIPGSAERINHEVNFIKAVLFAYPDTTQTIDTKTLNKIWHEIDLH